MKKLFIKEGTKFGKVTFIKESGIKAEPSGGIDRLANCKCDCGVYFTTSIYSINRGRVMSCGCAAVVSLKKRATKHGWCGTKTYKTWESMNSRCRNKNNPMYAVYGGRGIKICKRWHSFENFLEDMGERPTGKSIDRIDNDGNYCKENCRWSTQKEQNNNTSRNHFVEYKGERKTIMQWSEILGLEFSVICSRINRGWDVDRAMIEKVKKRLIISKN